MALGENYVSTIIKRSLILIFAISALCFFLFKEPVPYVLGIVCGGAANILNFKILEFSTKKAVMLSEGRAKAYATANYLIRFIIYGVVLVVSAKTEKISFIATILSIFVVKVVIISDSLYDTIKYRKAR